MKSDLPKVLHTAAGRTLLDWAFQAIRGTRTRPDSGRSSAMRPNGWHGPCRSGPNRWSRNDQLGTGHAVTVALAALDGLTDEDTVLITYGDMPLVTSDLLRRRWPLGSGKEWPRWSLSKAKTRPATAESSEMATGAFDRVVEEKDASPEQREITEVNAGIYAFSGSALGSALGKVATDNAQGEYYLPDVLPILIQEGETGCNRQRRPDGGVRGELTGSTGRRRGRAPPANQPELATKRSLDAGPRPGLHRRLGRARSRRATLSRRPSRRARPG